MRLIPSRSQRFFNRWTAFIVNFGLFSGVLLLTPLTAQGTAAAQVSPTETATSSPIPSPISSNDALIPAQTRTRFVGIPTGLGTVDLATVAFPYLGSPDAPIKIIQVSSYSCSSCRNYYDSIALNLLPAIQSGQVQFMLVPVTLTGEYDPSSETAAALCALDQGKFWEMTDVLFNWLSRYGNTAGNFRRLELAAIQLGLSADKFNTCLFGADIGTRVDADNQYFDTLRLQYTPSIIINGKWIDPSPSLNQLYQLINRTSPGTVTTPDSATPDATATDGPGNGEFTKLAKISGPQ